MANDTIFNVTLVGDQELRLRLDALGPSVVKSLRARIETLTMKLQTHIVRDKLHGQVLHQRSGRLARSIQRKIEATGLAVYGTVFSAGDVKYAAAHEFGFAGQVTVRQHMRTMVFGKQAAMPFAVGPYQMNMRIPERSFMRTGLADMREEISGDLKEAAIAGLNAAVHG